LLIIKRRSDDPHYAGKWDIPAGRLKIGENPVDGLKRETKEEVNLDIDILLPIITYQFTRDDDQK
jgi:8-oxo-dGTP diphosphatase